MTDAGSARSLAGARILVVGATGGLGGALCDALSAEGAGIVASGRDASRLAAVQLRLGDACVGTVTLDLARAGSADALIEHSVDGTGALDGVVIASGLVAFGAASELDDATAVHLFTVNTLAPIRVTRAAIPALRRSTHPSDATPFLLAISAIVAESPMAGMAAYSASKAALTAWNRAAGRELRRHGIRVIDARPPHTETGLAAHPISGTAPPLPPGLAPAHVAEVLVEAVLDGSTEVAAHRFGSPRQTAG